MMFVDGENFLIRGLAVAKAFNLEVLASDYYQPDAFLWVPGNNPCHAFTGDSRELLLQPQSVRSHYYTSLAGDEPSMFRARRALRKLDFDPHVFKRQKKEEKSKGVDITLTRDVLSHAFMNNYDAAVLVSGDGDFVPLVEEVKRLGKVVFCCFFDHAVGGLNLELKITCDAFIDMTQYFVEELRKRQASGAVAS
jgi:uncharacterized LabA/DUF88 family protein